MDIEISGDDEDLPTSKLRGGGLTGPKSGYSKMFKNKMESRKTFYIVLTLLIFILAVLIIAVFGLSFAYLKMTRDQRWMSTTKNYLRSDLTKKEGRRRTCTTANCLKSATVLVESMNKSVDPCEDFYQFACGNFAKLHKIPKTAISNDRFAELRASMLKLIRDFMETDDDDDDDDDNRSSSVSKFRRLYRSCMENTDETNTNITKQLVQMLDKIGLSFMVIGNRQKVSSLSSILARLKKQMNLEYLFATKVKVDKKNRTVYRISLDKPRNTKIFAVHKITENIKKISPRKMPATVDTKQKAGNTNIDFKNKYNKFISFIMCEIYKLQSNRCKMYKPILTTKKISQISSFNDEYAKIINKVYDSDVGLPLVITVDELQNYTNDITRNFTKSNEQIIDWKEYFTILFMDSEHVKLDFETDLIQVSNIEYFKALFELISKRKDKFILNIWLKVVETLLPYTTNKLRFIHDKFFNETKILKSNPSRSLYCAGYVSSVMGMTVSRLLLDLETIHNNMKMAAEIFKNIHWAFEKIVNELNWMDDTTKQRTLYKAQQMTTFIGFPEFNNDPVQLDDNYSEFEVIEDDYFENVINYIQQELKNTLIGIRQLNNYTKNDRTSNFLEVNAYYLIRENKIVVPAGILQFPFIGHDLQMLNYGFLGFILGHELTHGFGNIGQKFDHDGNENMWWTNQSIVEYEKRSDCFIHHYESYLIPGIENKGNGKKTLNENIADNGGLREAFWAYRKFINDNGEEPKLPGLEKYNNEQIFYLAFANNWCEATTPESLYLSNVDVHSPNSIRVIAGLTNSDEFSEVWKCKKGSKMNPDKEKCKIW